ncbi:MAG: hypothetical protein JWN40_1720 [Phycisphaerales bacterium]|nr:hypothetical protein [Phycisphaerales bacterium]
MRHLIATLALLFLSPLAFAAPPNAKHLPADAKWYLHLDVEAAKQTALFDNVLTAVKTQFPIDDVLAQLKAGIGVNPLTDITAITVYNNSFEKDVAAVVIYAKIDVGPLNNALAQNPDYKETVYGKHLLLGWTDNNDGKPKTGCFYGDGIILMADKVDTLKLAVDTLDGTKPAGSALVKEPAKGVFLSAAADLAHANDPNVAQLLSSSQAATASIGETADGKLQVSVNLTAKSPEQAAQIKKMLDGVAAFGQLATRDVPTAAALLNQVTVTADGAKVIATFQHDSKTLLQTLQKIDQENKARMAAPKPAQPNGL